MNTAGFIARPLKLLFAAGAALLVCWPAHGGKPRNWTEAEVQAAAPFCIDTMGFKYGDAYGASKSPRADYWVALMGQGFWDMHHYCWARMQVARSMRSGLTQQQRHALRVEALTDYDYVTRRAKPDFPMLAEVYMRAGEAHTLLGNRREAFTSFARAAEAKPDFWPIFLHWGRALKDAGDLPKAREVVLRGLRLAPQSTALRELAKDLKITRIPDQASPDATSATGSSPVAE